jgi:hypothetical protein
MENQKEYVKKIAYSYGVYLGLVTIILLVIMYVLNIDKSWVLSIISTLITIILFVLGIKAFKKENQNFISIEEAIKVGLAIAAIGGLVAAIYTFFHYEYIYPEFIENLREQSLIEAKKDPKEYKEKKEMIKKYINIFTSPFILSTISLIATLFFGFIISLITGAIIKKERPEF